MTVDNSIPVVLCFGGHDPTGGAGVQADIEAIGALRCHAATLITALTEQDTRQLYDYQTVNVDHLRRQTERLLADLSPAAIKVGMLGSVDNLRVVAQVAHQQADLPLVVDPVLSAGGGGSLGGDGIVQALCQQLIPLATVITPNTEELYRLTGETNQHQAAQLLLASGCQAVLVTGTHADTVAVINTLYQAGHPPLAHSWLRLPHDYHGSGCTLASAIAAGLAIGKDVETAVLNAQDYTWESLERGSRPGSGQWIPGRAPTPKPFTAKAPNN